MARKPAVPERLRRQVQERAQGRCEYCLIHEADMYYPHEPDHVIAEKHGGQLPLRIWRGLALIATGSKVRTSLRSTRSQTKSSSSSTHVSSDGIAIFASTAVVSKGLPQVGAPRSRFFISMMPNG